MSRLDLSPKDQVLQPPERKDTPGSLLMKALGLLLRARYYDPEAGRFTSRDPAKDGLNWYAYCRQNPLIYVDPDGECPLPIITGGDRSCGRRGIRGGTLVQTRGKDKLG